MPAEFVHTTAIVETDEIGSGTRIWAYAHILPGARVGRNCNIGDHVFVETGACVGNNVTIKNQVCIWEGVTIEDDCFIGPGVVFTNDLLPRSPRMKEAADRYRRQENWLQRTVAGRGCSIGANATILPGIRLGDYSMIAAGATVTRDVEPHALVIGTPARQAGFVCRCGTRLASLMELATCSECGALTIDDTFTIDPIA